MTPAPSSTRCPFRPETMELARRSCRSFGAMASICDAARNFRISRQSATGIEGGADRPRERSCRGAAYHAAQAFIFERTGKAAKSHNGVRSEFARLAKEDPRIDRSFAAFLARAYNLKAMADYAIGDDVGVSLSEAGQAIESAARFVACVSRLLEPHE
ncbi:HEPN domain-containing protein [Methylocystis suflitae]|uniref:HEPN domain-containing protein n=1 Tax=Methylocystis suflitae TaxID=2951405 RepID=UPI0038993B5F